MTLYYKRLIEWNEKINLTAITDPYEVAVKHFLDSLAIFAKVCAGARVAVTLIDVGTGAGFPGIPLKIANPQIQLTLLDSLQKRVKFLEEVIRDLELEGGRFVFMAARRNWRMTRCLESGLILR